jgi:hypothetical protein
MCLSAYVCAHQYPAARKTHGVHMHTYAYVRIRPRGKRAESTRVRTRTYVSGRMENVWSPHAYIRTRPRTPYGGYSPRTHAYARMTSLPCVRTQRHLHTQKLLTSFWRENFSRWVADVILAGKFFQMGGYYY